MIRTSTLIDAKNLLNTYTRHGSMWGRFWRLEWNHHHTQEVEKILSDDNITSMPQLILRLEAIRLVNKKGRLATIIGQIERMYSPTVAVKPDISPTHKAIATFLNCFNYLNPQKRRHGIRFWLNEKLTQQLENNAISLVNKVNQIIATDVSDDLQFNQFIAEIRKAIDCARQKRSELAPIETHASYSADYQLHHDPFRAQITGISTYKIPYAAGKFEENIKHALMQAKQILSDTPKNTDKLGQIDEMVRYIDAYNPGIKHLEEHNYKIYH